MPPEIVNHQKYDSKVDIWSAGIVTYVMLTGKPPFFGSSKAEVYKAITEDKIDVESNL
jgi:calcium/calmodulin-dependent protein kinase I